MTWIGRICTDWLSSATVFQTAGRVLSWAFFYHNVASTTLESITSLRTDQKNWIFDIDYSILDIYSFHNPENIQYRIPNNQYPTEPITAPIAIGDRLPIFTLSEAEGTEYRLPNTDY